MRLVSVAMGEVAVLEVIGQLLRRRAETEGDVGGGYALGRNQNVGLYVPVIDSEPFARASPAGHHLVGNHQDVVTVADFAQAGEVFGRRNEDAVGTDDRLYDDRRYVALVFDHVLDVIDAGYVAAGIGVFDGAPVAVGFR